MTLRELLRDSARAINADPWLRERRCEAFSESDADDWGSRVAEALALPGGVVIVAFCRETRPLGATLREAVVEVAATERPPEREQRGGASAADVARRVSEVLSRPGGTVGFTGIRQEADESTATITATASFRVAFDEGGSEGDTATEQTTNQSTTEN